MQNWDLRRVTAGLIFACVGVVGVVLSTRLDVGRISDLGSGGFPLLLSALLVTLGAAQMISARRHGPEERQGRGAGRAAVLIPLSALTFGLSIDRIGLAPAVILATALAGLANPTLRIAEIAILCIALAAGSAGLFIYGLGLPFALFGPR